MKRILFALTVVAFGCKSETNKPVGQEVESVLSEEVTYASFGGQIDKANALSSAQMMAKYGTMKLGDTLEVTTAGQIIDVCSKKGCWMKLDMGNNNAVRVTFKDYGFFVPTDASGEAIVNGKAYISEISVEELKHYAEDAGQSIEEINAITDSEVTYSFEADGVLLKN